MFGFIEIGDFVWDIYISVVVDFSYERLKIEFFEVIKIYVLMYNILCIDVVNKKGLVKIIKLENKFDKVIVFFSLIYILMKE